MMFKLVFCLKRVVVSSRILYLTKNYSNEYSRSKRKASTKKTTALGGFFIYYKDATVESDLHFHIYILGKFTQHINITSKFIVIPSKNFSMANRDHNILRELNTEAF